MQRHMFRFKRCLSLIGIGMALASMTVTVRAQSPADSWKHLVAEAEKEGSISLAGPQSASTRGVIESFQKDFPRIKMRYTSVQGEFWTRLASERAAGVYAWDIFVGGAAETTYEAMRKGWLLPIRSALVRPDVLEDKNWIGGFDAAFGDHERKFVFMFAADRLKLISVNRSKIPDADLASTKQLLDPRWKGQIVMIDPRLQGVGSQVFAGLQTDLGEENAARFLKEMDIVFTKDRRQAAEWVIRGRYPIGVGVVSFHFTQFFDRGLGKDIAYLDLQNPIVSSGQSSLTLISNPPNPNAAKVFANWLLTRDIQQAWAKVQETNSLRADVPVQNLETAVSEKQLETLPHQNTEGGVKYYFQQSSATASRLLE